MKVAPERLQQARGGHAGPAGRAAGGSPRPADFSGLYLAYRPALTGDPDAALDATERLIAELRDSGARIPGEASQARRERCLADGQVDVDQQALDLLDPIVPP